MGMRPFVIAMGAFFLSNLAYAQVSLPCDAVAGTWQCDERLNEVTVEFTSPNTVKVFGEVIKLSGKPQHWNSRAPSFFTITTCMTSALQIYRSSDDHPSSGVAWRFEPRNGGDSLFISIGLSNADGSMASRANTFECERK